MQRHAEQAGFSVVTQYVGHGIGRIMHENPQVPNFISRELRRHDFRLEEGLVIAVEPMVNMGRSEADTLSDHWTVVTRDGMPSVHVEHTLALTRRQSADRDGRGGGTSGPTGARPPSSDASLQRR